MDESESTLRRTLTTRSLTVYAVGDILGAGIYVLVGRVAATADAGAWLSMLVAAAVAAFTGLTYAELSSRYPHAAGAAAYTRRAFAHPLPAFLVGVFVLASGITSAATVSLAFIGYLTPFFAPPPVVASVVLLAAMTALNFWGMRESVRVNLVLTLVEASGLVLVLVVGVVYAVGHLPATELVNRLAVPADLGAVLAGATLAFYAYIGFEDTANVAEEVHDASRALPRAILGAIGITSLVYLAVTVAALWVVPRATLTTSSAPLLEVLNAAGVVLPGGMFSLVALCAICNTGLLNLIMASRLTYGMAREGLLPAVLGRVHPVRCTPWVAVLVAFALAVLLAVSGGVQALAQTTSLLLLSVFTVLHVGLLVVKRRVPGASHRGFVTPWWTPIVGAGLSGALLVQYPYDAYARAGAVLAAGAVLYVFLARRDTREP